MSRAGKNALVAACLLLACNAGESLAQSTFSISGTFKVSVDNTKISSSSRKIVNSETRVADETSYMTFRVTENLGGGLYAFARLDWRFAMDSGIDDTNGVSVIGLQDWKSFGRLMVGGTHLHWYNNESYLNEKAGSLRLSSVSLLSFIGTGLFAIANAGRTSNLIHYTTPDWRGFNLIAAYSTSPVGTVEQDIGSSARKGRGWNLQGNFKQGGFQAGYSHWDAKPDDPIVFADQIGRRWYGSYDWGVFKVGFAFDQSMFKQPRTRAKLSYRNAWSLPMHYKMGDHSFYTHYTVARDDTIVAGQNGAKMLAFAYNYDLSKLTSVGVSWGKITNNPAARYNFFTTTGPGGSPGVAVLPGEDPRFFAMTLRQSF